MATKHFPKGLDGRMRDQDGEIWQKRSDTKVETLRKTYGQDFAKGYSSAEKFPAFAFTAFLLLGESGISRWIRPVRRAAH